MVLNYVTTLKFWEYFNLVSKVPQRSVGSDPTNEAVGNSDGTASQTFYTDQENIINTTQTVYVNSNLWTRVDDFTGSNNTDTHYTFNYDSGLITFGDDTNGMIPPTNEAITASYKFPSLDNVNNAGIQDSVVQRHLERSEKDVERMCARTWTNETITNELQDSQNTYDRDYFTFVRPIISLTTFQVNLSSDDEDDNWRTLTEANNEIEVTLDTGRITITEPIFNSMFQSTDTNNKLPPPNQRNRVRITYQAGATSVPEDIEELTLLVGAQKLKKSVVDRSLISGRNEFNPSLIDVSKSDIDETVANLRSDSIRSV